MIGPTSLNAFEQKISGTFAISFLIIMSVIIMSTSLFIIKVDDVDAQLQTVKTRDLVIGFENNTVHSRAQLTLPAISNVPFPRFIDLGICFE